MAKLHRYKFKLVGTQTCLEVTASNKFRAYQYAREHEMFKDSTSKSLRLMEVKS